VVISVPYPNAKVAHRLRRLHNMCMSISTCTHTSTQTHTHTHTHTYVRPPFPDVRFQSMALPNADTLSHTSTKKANSNSSASRNRKSWSDVNFYRTIPRNLGSSFWEKECILCVLYLALQWSLQRVLRRLI